jgi:hypothetical protein
MYRVHERYRRLPGRLEPIKVRRLAFESSLDSGGSVERPPRPEKVSDALMLRRSRVAK